MAATVQRKRGRTRRPQVLHSPRGVIHPRVQTVGPEHFGIVAVDCAKARSKWMLSNFYGKVLVDPTLVEHNRNTKRDSHVFPATGRFGRPRSRTLDSSPSFLIVCWRHAGSPKGRPLAIEVRISASSVSVCGSFTHLIQSGGRETGHSFKIPRCSGEPCSRRQRAPHFHPSARSTAPARNGFRST